MYLLFAHQFSHILMIQILRPDLLQHAVYHKAYIVAAVVGASRGSEVCPRLYLPYCGANHGFPRQSPPVRSRARDTSSILSSAKRI